MTNLSPMLSAALILSFGALLFFARVNRRKAVTIQYGCRSKYGPLDLRIHPTGGTNRFMVYVEDSRIGHRIVHEHAAQSTLESAQAYLTLRADEYLTSQDIPSRYELCWRSS
jgi:hypothetical protein